MKKLIFSIFLIFVLLSQSTIIIIYLFRRAPNSSPIESKYISVDDHNTNLINPSIDSLSFEETNDAPPPTLNTHHHQNSQNLFVEPLDQSSKPEKRKTKIPRIVHYIFGLKDNFGGKPFGIVQYISILSSYKFIRPEKIYFHYLHEPEGFWWQKSKPYLTMVKVKPVTHINGVYIKRTAHRADVIRLRVLKKFGGIYLDMDTLVLHPFTDQLLEHDMVMGQEGENGRVGLCNAIILASPDSVFLEKWLTTYNKFNPTEWNYHSVQLPKELMKDMPMEIFVLDYRKFFWPLWDDKGIEDLYEKNEYDFSGNLACHLWEKNSYEKYHRNLMFDSIFNPKTTFQRMLNFIFYSKPVSMEYLTSKRHLAINEFNG